MRRRFWENLGTLALAVLLAVVVWVVAVNEENPTEEKTFPDAVKVELLHLPPNLILVEAAGSETTVTIRAPQSVWETLVADQIHVTADLEDQTPGAHDVPLTVRLDVAIGQVTRLNPASLRLTLESRATRALPVSVEQSGELARGYEAGPTTLSAPTAGVTGPASAVVSFRDIQHVTISGGTR